LLWRCSNYAEIDGAGGFHASGRWHTVGRPVVYCALNASTALLETLVHLRGKSSLLPVNARYFKFDCPEDASRESIAKRLPQDWRHDLVTTRRLGDEWLDSGRSLLLEVPCAIAPQTTNILINPRHREIVKIRKAGHEALPIDRRLL